jgi:hypothetical protein
MRDIVSSNRVLATKKQNLQASSDEPSDYNGKKVSQESLQTSTAENNIE